MTDYPYDFGTGYKVQTIFANKTQDRMYGDIYDFRSDAEREHPGADILTGYCVIDVALGLVPNGCNDWNNSISDAIKDYEEHIVPFLDGKQNDVVKTLISAMSDYGMENFWNDSDIIAALVDLGVTQEDFEKAGYQDFVKEYFEEEEIIPSEEKYPEKPVNGMDQVLSQLVSVAQKNFLELENRSDLETHNSDSADFFTTSVWSLKAALIDAYNLGREHSVSHLAENVVSFSVNMDTTGLSVPNYVGTWHSIDHTTVDGHTFWLMEHDKYGDDAACIIVDDRGKLSLANVHDGFDEHTIDLLRQEVMSVDRMPDNTITVNEMKDYGYGWGGMLPMRESAAAEVMKNCTIYRLYNDDTEGMVMDESELKTHSAQGGIFGVEKVEWQTFLDRPFVQEDSPEIMALKGEISNLLHEFDGIAGYADEEELAPIIAKQLFIRECQLCAAMNGVQIDKKRLDAIELDVVPLMDFTDEGKLYDYLIKEGFIVKKSSLEDQIHSASSRANSSNPSFNGLAKDDKAKECVL